MDVHGLLKRGLVIDQRFFPAKTSANLCDRTAVNFGKTTHRFSKPPERKTASWWPSSASSRKTAMGRASR